MKNVLVVILLVATLGLGAGWLYQLNQSKQSATQLAAQQHQVAELEAAAAAAEAQAGRLREKLEAAQMESAANAGQAAQLSVALTNRIEEVIATLPEETNSKPANPLADMFKSPEMRDMIKQQQKTVLGGLVDKNYAAFFKAMNLTPEQSAAMKDLIMNKMLGDTEMGLEMMGGDLTPEQREAMVAAAKERKDTLNQQMKELLGEENFSTYEAYEKSVPDRMAVSQLNDQLGANLALNSEQENLLIQAMSEERLGFKFTTDFNNQNDFSADFASRFTEENLNVFLQEQQRLNQNYLNRAQTILSADQLTAYQKALTAQQEMTKMGMRMAVQMFGPKKK
jgi:hypothetical protein